VVTGAATENAVPRHDEQQHVQVRPRLNRRSDRVLAGGDAPRSRDHLYYVALEVAKVAALIALGVGLLTVR
jgi:hypothetical protein